ncbi:protein kinase-like protein [Trypanosoma cruzi]|nr:protein kinase-like protein [Trypanosoma cruzi]
MAVGASSRTAQRTPARERRQVISPDVSGQFRVTTFLSLDAFALQHFFLDDHSATGKEGRMFRAFDSTNWPRVYGMRAFPESFWTSGAHTIIGARRRTRPNLSLTVCLRGCVRWKRSGIPPIES